MTGPGVSWSEIGPGRWRATIGEAVLSVGRLATTGEWTYHVRFPDGRQVTPRHPYLTRGNAQAAAERAAAE